MGITGKNVTVAIMDAFFNPNDPDISPRVSYSAVFAACDDLTCGDSQSPARNRGFAYSGRYGT